MTYVKLVANGSKRHLMKPDQLEDGATLCGCFITDVLGWRRISALEGDECKKCAEIAFDASNGGGKQLSRNAKSAGR